MIVYRVQLDNIDNDALAARCYEIMSMQQWQNTYDSNDDITGKETRQSHALSNYVEYANPHSWEEFKPVREVVQKLVTPYVIHRSWFAVSSKGGSIKEHVHDDKISSGELCDKYAAAYYVKCNDDHPPFEYFEDGVWKAFKPTTGSLIVFTNNLLHRVPVSTSDEDRISIALNI